MSRSQRDKRVNTKKVIKSVTDRFIDFKLGENHHCTQTHENTWPNRPEIEIRQIFDLCSEKHLKTSGRIIISRV